MTTMLITLAKKDLATIKASAKAWDVLQTVIGLENYSEALALSYIDCLKEQLDAAGFSNDDYKSKLSKRKKVLLFAAGADKGQEGWSDIAIDLEAEAMLKQPSLETAYKYATESIKLAKTETEDEGSDGEGEGSEGELLTLNQMINETAKLWQEFHKKGATNSQLLEVAEKLHDAVKAAMVSED